jgi:hypothetical protein
MGTGTRNFTQKFHLAVTRAGCCCFTAAAAMQAAGVR